MTVTLVALTQINSGMQLRLQTNQQTLSTGILGPQGRQISSAVLKELAAASATNANIRTLVEKHGYRLQPGP